MAPRGRGAADAAAGGLGGGRADGGGPRRRPRRGRPVLASGDAVFAAARAVEHDPGPTRARLRAALAPVAEAGPLPLAAALATLLRRAADPGGVAAAAAELGAGARAVAARMLEAALEETPPIEALDLRGAAERMAQFLGRAESMARCGLLGPEGVRRLLGRQREAAEACRRRLAAGAETQVIAPLTALAEAAEVTDGAVAEVEAAARGLRVVARAGRGAGDPAAHDRALRALADGVAALRHRAVRPGGLTPMDLARAVEILAGPEAAEALLRGAAGPPG